MTVQEKKWLVMSAIGTVIFLLSGMNGIINKEKRNNESDYLMSMNTCFLGVSFLFSFIASLLFYQYGRDMLKEEVFYAIMIAGMSFGLLITGIHGILNEKKINNLVFVQFSKAQLGGGIIGFIALLVFLLSRH